MFCLENPSAHEKPWILSKANDTKPIYIPKNVANSMNNYDVMPVEFLYHNYRKGLRGSILNEENGMNFPLQISAFLRALSEESSPVLIICSAESYIAWHYHLTRDGNYKLIKITPTNVSDNYPNHSRIALLLENSDLKLAGDLRADFFSIVIEDFDLVANKNLIKQLQGKFNIGLTHRSFYTNPDQKLQWKMLNWANPGCVGKLNDFYEVDNNNFENLRDNYRFWWFRLTWNFCESFVKPTEEEMAAYNATLDSWAMDNSLVGKSTKRASKRKLQKPQKFETDDNNSEPIDKLDLHSDTSVSSDATIIEEVPLDKYVKLPSMDENPILTSIIKNFEASPEPTYYPRRSKYKPPMFPQPTCSKLSAEDNSGILSIIESQPCTSRSESEDFIISLIRNSSKQNETVKEQTSFDGDIDQLLKEADVLLQN